MPTANASAGQGIDCQVRNSLKAYEVLAMCGMLPDSEELNPPVFASSVNCDQKLAPNETPSASRLLYAHTHTHRNYQQFRIGIVGSSNALKNLRSLSDVSCRETSDRMIIGDGICINCA